MDSLKHEISHWIFDNKNGKFKNGILRLNKSVQYQLNFKLTSFGFPRRQLKIYNKRYFILIYNFFLVR